MHEHDEPESVSSWQQEKLLNLASGLRLLREAPKCGWPRWRVGQMQREHAGVPCKSPAPAALARLTSQLLLEMMCFDVSSTVTLHLVALLSNTLARHCHASKCVCIAVTGARFSGNMKAIISEASAWLL